MCSILAHPVIWLWIMVSQGWKTGCECGLILSQSWFTEAHWFRSVKPLRWWSTWTCEETEPQGSIQKGIWRWWWRRGINRLYELLSLGILAISYWFIGELSSFYISRSHTNATLWSFSLMFASFSFIYCWVVVFYFSSLSRFCKSFLHWNLLFSV